MPGIEILTLPMLSYQGYHSLDVYLLYWLLRTKLEWTQSNA